MQRTRLAALAAAPIALIAAEAAAADPAVEVLEGFTAHRAVYDLELARADSSSNIAAAAGRLVFEFTGSTCDGYSVNSRFVTRLQDQDGSERITDLRSATYETLDPATFTFNNRTFVNQVEQDRVAGRATAIEDGLEVELDAPERLLERIDVDAVFPTRHVANLLVAARAGEKIHEADVYDGAEDGTKVFATTTVIGPERAGVGDPAEGEASAVIGLPDDLVHWRMNMSYFDLEGASGEVTSSYELGFVLYDNGISRDLTFDYGSFALRAHLSDLEIIDTPPCE